MATTDASSPTKPFRNLPPPRFTGFSDYPPLPPPLTPAEDFELTTRRVGAVRLDGVTNRELRWLWPGRIPIGRLTLLVGDPGLGKSLVALDIAARVSRGSEWPDANSKPQSEIRGSAELAEVNPQSDPVPQPSTLRPRLATLDPKPYSVLLVTPEDDLGDTIRPRIDALGADPSRIVALYSFPPPTHGKEPGESDLDRIVDVLNVMSDCRLVVIDPITAYIGNAGQLGSARKLLSSLAGVAADRLLAVLAISHLRKKDGAAIHRTLGSLAFVSIARTAWVITKDPIDPQRRLFLPVKNNLAQDSTGLAYSIESTAPGGPPIIRWSPDAVTVSAETIVGNARGRGRPDDDRQEAVAWLQKKLAGGPRPSRDIKDEAEANGICFRTLKRAYRDLKGESIRQGPFPSGQWLWRLPGVEGQN